MTQRAMTRREWAAQEAESRAQQHADALAALHERASRFSAKHSPAAETASVTENAGTDRRADRRTEDRVHAWYRANHPTVSAVETEDQPVVRPAKQPKATVAADVKPDLSATARKATSADFARAAAVQRETILASRDQQARQTTADDDNADAESRIPSTAPTEREPAPFVHGSFGVEDPGAPTRQAVPVSRTRNPAPIVRESPVAVTATAALTPPQHVDLKHRGDGLTTSLASDTIAESDAAAKRGKGAIPVVIASDSSTRAIRALAVETAASPTPQLKLPAPPAAALHKDLPAVAAVQSSAKKRDLDPAVAADMAEETFDGGDAPAAAPRTVRVARADADVASTTAYTVPVNLFDRQGHLVTVPPMKGSHEILVHQNQMALSDGLERIQDDDDLLEMRRRKLLVALPNQDSVYPDDHLPANRRYARPWVVQFIRDIARAHYARFGTPLIVTSAVRTVEFQRRLVRVNGNAAPPTGDIASPHLYGQAIDFAKGHMSLTEVMWMRAYLTPIENDGKIDVEEEFQQSCFHMSVYRRYLGLPQQRQEPAQQLQRPLLVAKTPAAPDAVRPEKKHRRISTAMLATGLR